MLTGPQGKKTSSHITTGLTLVFVVARNEPSIFHSWCYTEEKSKGKQGMNIELYLKDGKFKMEIN